MAAVLREGFAAAGQFGRLSHTSQSSNELVDRRALADVLSVADGNQSQGSDEEIWMMSYMDIVTLLLTLFVLLLAFSKVTPETIQVAPVVQSVKQAPAANADSASIATATPVSASVVKTMPAAPAAPVSSTQQPLPPVPVVMPSLALRVPAPQPAAATRRSGSPSATLNLVVLGAAATADTITPPLRALAPTVVPLRQSIPDPTPVVAPAIAARERLLAAVRDSALGQRIELSVDQDNVNLDISDNILFDPGSATLKPDGQRVLNELAGMLAAQDYTVSIEGHSDNVPFSNRHFASNWELSATRATNVTRYLIAHNIEAARLRAIGYADTRPRVANDSVQGKARNRRVALVLHLPVPGGAAVESRSGSHQAE